MVPHEPVAIIGGGPAGVACAVQLRRYGFDPLIIDRDDIGGLVKNAWRLDNYPGFPEGISGPDLAEKLKQHVERFDIRYLISEIQSSVFIGDRFLLKHAEGEITCKYLVIATGTRARYVIPQDFSDIFTEVYPIRHVKGKTIGIAGSGDAAFDYALTLSENNKITVHNRGNTIKCIPALHKIAMKHPNINYVENSVPSFSDDYTIFATGREPELGLLMGYKPEKRRELEQNGMLYVIGDVKNGMVRQTAVAAGDGIRAAMAIRETLLHEGNQQNPGK